MTYIKERKVQWHSKTLKGISQIPTDGLEFAYVSEDYRQVHQLVWCKDFMQDALFGFLNKEPIEIYGFEYDHQKNPPIYLDKTRMMLCNWRDTTFNHKLLINCCQFLNELETRLKLRKSVFEKCVNPPPIYRKSGVFIIEGSKRWMIAPPMISLYTLLIRIGLVHPLGQSAEKTLRQIFDLELKPYNWKPDKPGSGYIESIHEDNDADNLKNGIKGFNRIIEHGDRKLFHKNIEDNYKYDDVYTIHDDCGLHGFSNNFTDKYFPHWHKLKDESCHFLSGQIQSSL